MPDGPRTELPAGRDSRRRLHLCGGGGRASTAVGNDVRYQATITRRRAIAPATAARSPRGSASRAGSSPVPPARRRRSKCRLRVAVVQGGVNEKTIATKAYRTTVTMTEDGIDAVHAGRRRSGLSGAAGRGRRCLHLLYRLRPAGADAEPKPGKAPTSADEANQPASFERQLGYGFGSQQSFARARRMGPCVRRDDDNKKAGAIISRRLRC